MEQWFSETGINFVSNSDPDERIVFKPAIPEHYNISTRVILEFNGKVTAHFDDDNACNIIELDTHSPKFFDDLREFLNCSCSSVGRAGLSKSLDTGSNPVRSAKP